MNAHTIKRLAALSAEATDNERYALRMAENAAMCPAGGALRAHFAREALLAANMAVFCRVRTLEILLPSLTTPTEAL